MGVMGEGKLVADGVDRVDGVDAIDGLGSEQISAQIIQELMHAHVFPLQKSRKNDENQQSPNLYLWPINFVIENHKS